MKHFPALSLCALITIMATSAFAAPYATYNSRAAWQAAVGNNDVPQNYEGYAAGTNLNGVDVLSSVNITGNFPTIEAWSSGDINCFGYNGNARSNGDAYYDINLALPYKAVGFDIEAWDPVATDAGIIEILFGNGDTASFNIYQTNASESDPVFVGIVSGMTIQRVRYYEPHEFGNPLGGNEETAIDNLAISRVPEPATIALLATGVLTIFRHRRAA